MTGLPSTIGLICSQPLFIWNLPQRSFMATFSDHLLLPVTSLRLLGFSWSLTSVSAAAKPIIFVLFMWMPPFYFAKYASYRKPNSSVPSGHLLFTHSTTQSLTWPVSGGFSNSCWFSLHGFPPATSHFPRRGEKNCSAFDTALSLRLD